MDLQCHDGAVANDHAMIPPSRHQETGILREVWREFNRLRDYVDSLKPAPGKNVHIKHTSQGMVLSVLPTTKEEDAQGTELKTFRIVSIQDNDLTCVEWDGETAGSAQVTVAKPWTLRRYVYENDTSAVTYVYVSVQRRTATQGSTSETQDITKSYVVGEMLVAVKLTTVRPAGEGGRTEWEWLDINMDGRDWARAVA